MPVVHFQYPQWLLLLPALLGLAVWFGWKRARDVGWSGIIDAELLASLRLSGGSRSGSPWVWVGIAWLLAVVALAGPSWEHRQVKGYRGNDSWVVVLDLSPSMRATDLKPDRITRARYAVLDVLKAAHGARTALVVFAGEAHTVSPLTTDTHTVESLLRPLDPDLMPERGNNVTPALEEAGRLLQRSNASRQIIVFSDGFADPSEAFAEAHRLEQQGIRINVVGTGTEQGAPEPDGAGGFVQDGTGRLAINRLQTDQLQRLAAAGDGRFVPLNAANDLVKAMDEQRSTADATPAGSDVNVSAWANGGVFLLPPLLLVCAMLARRGWL